jgi:virginiamycin B lyase
VSQGDRVARFDPATQRFKEWGLPAGVRPHGVVVGSDGIVFFGGNGNGTLGELNPSTGVVRLHKTSDPASGIYSVVKDSDGNIWFTERKIGRIGRLDRTTGAMSSFPVGGGEPYGIVQDKRGRIWVTKIAGDKLACLDPRTAEVTEIATGAGSKPRRIAVAPDGMLWVTLYGFGKLAKVDPVAGRIVKEYDLPGGARGGPYSAVADAAGRIWVSIYQTDSVVVFDPATEKFRVFPIPGIQSGIRNSVIDQAGRYWYLATSLGRLGVIQ